MAWLEQRNKNYQIVLRFDGKKCKRSLKTSAGYKKVEQT